MAAQLSTHTTLLNRLAGDDSAAWSEFVERYGALIRTVTSRYGLQTADADDVLQDVLIGLSKAMPRFKYDPARARFRTFLQSIVQRVVFRKFRQKTPAVGIDEVERLQAGADQIWEDEWRQYHMRRAMETIEVEFTPREREIFAMYVGAQTPADQTAATLGIKLDQVYQAKSRILKRLADLIRAQIDEEG